MGQEGLKRMSSYQMGRFHPALIKKCFIVMWKFLFCCVFKQPKCCHWNQQHHSLFVSVGMSVYIWLKVTLSVWEILCQTRARVIENIWHQVETCTAPVWPTCHKSATLPQFCVLNSGWSKKSITRLFTPLLIKAAPVIRRTWICEWLFLGPWQMFGLAGASPSCITSGTQAVE